MQERGRKATGVVVALSVVVWGGCNQLFGIEEGHLVATLDAGNAGVATLDAGDADGADGGGDATPLVPVSSSCNARPDPNAGAFVSAAGSGTPATTGCTQATPCKTIEEGAAWASVQHRIVVYIDVGVYTEQLNVRAGLTYQGAWTFGQNGGWTRLCTGDSPIPSAVTIKAPSNKNVTAIARNLNGEAALEALTLVGRDLPAAPGESMYGLMVVGDTALTRVRLVDVFVSAPRAGDGKSGGIGATGATGPATCAAGDPVTPAQEAPGAGGQAKDAVFDANGYHPADGTTGNVGKAGGNGKSNGGESKGCFECWPNPELEICTSATYTAHGGASTPGCGGAGGDGGPIGGGGGSSFGVFVWGATVGAERGGFVAAQGGGGGAGGEGGQGGAGTGGTDGTSAACTKQPKPSCGSGGGADYPNNCSYGDIPGTPAAGGAASAGAKGGTGGAGGGGAGGSSYAYYAGGSGVVALNGTTLTHGGGGRAGSNGVPAATPGIGAEHN